MSQEWMRDVYQTNAIRSGIRCIKKAGGQKLRFKDTLGHYLQNVGIDHKNWEMIACDSSMWRK